MSVTYKEHDKGIIEYILTNHSGMTVKIINVGCSITEIFVLTKTVITAMWY